MIIDFNVNINSYEEKTINSEEIFDYQCPKCGAKHALTRHGSYIRNISYIEDDNIINSRLSILRLMCGSCGSTHAILPKDIIPYCIYTYTSVLTILTQHYDEGESVLAIASKYKISYQLIYEFINRFYIFYERCKSLLRAMGILREFISVPTQRTVIQPLNDNKIINRFQQYYLASYQKMFLMKKFQNGISPQIYIGYQ